MRTIKKLNTLSKRMSHTKHDTDFYLDVIKKKVTDPKTIGIALSALAGLFILRKISGRKNRKIVLERTTTDTHRKPKKGIKSALMESAALLGSVAVSNVIRRFFKK